MNSENAQTADAGKGATGWKVVADAALIVLIGGALAFAANGLSPRGLSLATNYFPSGTNGLVSAPITPVLSVASHPGATNSSTTQEALAAHLKAVGLELISRADAVRLFHDPRYQQEMVLIVDARNDEHYQAGHIPGAFQLDRYHHPETYLATVLPACQTAEVVMVYCDEVDCQDSEFTAILLRDAGVPNEKLRIYGGGMTDWATNNLPVEIGERNSRRLRSDVKQ